MDKTTVQGTPETGVPALVDKGYPVRILRYHQKGKSTAAEVVACQDPETVNHFRVMAVGKMVILDNPAKLNDVPSPVLLTLINKARGADDPKKAVIGDRADAEAQVWALLPTLSEPYEIPTTPEDTTMASTKGAKKTPAKKTPAKKAANTGEAKPKKEGGVIFEIKKLLDRKSGVSQAEAVEKLSAKFPDRDAKGMGQTFKIQVSRLKVSTGRDILSEANDKRGRVYRFADAGGQAPE